VHHSGQVVAALLAAALYATHLPERIWPGKNPMKSEQKNESNRPKIHFFAPPRANQPLT